MVSKTLQINGQFEVALSPLESTLPDDCINQAGRMQIEKTYSGELDAKSRGEMLSLRTVTVGSAGYVAIELVTGSLNGKHGSFALQHFGVMHDGENRLILEVIPNSGTNELTGLMGTMNIQIKDGQHQYTFDYSLASS